MQICSSNRSLCCLILSAWAVIQLSILGIFFFINSLNLLEDVPVPYEKVGENDFYDIMEHNYRQVAYNCWIAAVLHVISGLFYAWLLRRYRRRQAI